jgi:hypothetical protein
MILRRHRRPVTDRSELSGDTGDEHIAAGVATDPVGDEAHVPRATAPQ